MVLCRSATVWAAIAALVVSVLGSPDRVAAQSLTLSKAIDEATGDHPSVSVAEADRQLAEARRRQRGTDFIPTLEGEANLFAWDDELQFSVGPSGDAANLPPPQDPYEAAVAGLIDGSEPTVIREQVTFDATLRLTQPLTPIWAIYESWRARRSGQRAAEADLDRAERGSARRVTVAYLRALKAGAKLDTASASVEQLETQLDRVEALVEVGRAQRSEQLRTEVALADARQTFTKARSQVELARSELASALGRSPGDKPEPAPLEPDALTAEPPPLQDLTDRAVDNRPQLRSLDRRLSESRRAVRARRARTLPRLAGVAQYRHTEGRGLTGSDEAFVGLSLTWQFLQWGRPLYAVDEARARMKKLEAQRRQTEHQVAVDVRRAWHNLRSAIDSYEVADRAVERAEEAYRVESARLDAGRATPSDLLDTEAALTEARNNRHSAFYDILIHRAALNHATGQPLTASRILHGAASAR